MSAVVRRLATARAALQFRNLGVALVVIVLVAIFGGIEPLFLRAANLSAIAQSIGILIVLAVGQMLVVITRNIDLSVGSALGLAAMSVGLAARDHPGLPVLVLIGIAIVVGAIAGGVNGLLITIGEVPPIIATLGTLAVFRGLVFVLSDSRQVDPQDIPHGITRLAAPAGTYFTWLLLFAGLIVVAGWYATRRTLTGRRLFAIGSNPDAARARGLSVSALTFGVFVAMGALAGLGGLLYVARYATVNPADVGLGYELTVVSAVVIGGTNIFGGSGSIAGTVLGCVLVGILANGLTVIGVSNYWQSAAEGAIILVAVIADTVVRNRAALRRVVARRSGTTWTSV